MGMSTHGSSLNSYTLKPTFDLIYLLQQAACVGAQAVAGEDWGKQQEARCSKPQRKRRDATEKPRATASFLKR